MGIATYIYIYINIVCVIRYCIVHVSYVPTHAIECYRVLHAYSVLH